MSGRRILVLAGALASAALLIQPADGATVRRHVPCSTFYFVFGGLLGGSTNSSSVSIRNSLSSAIPAGTVFHYTVSGDQRSHTASAALAPGETLTIPDAAITDSGSCDAWFSETRSVLKNLDLDNLQKLQLQPAQ
jgi:hypothetical protein